MYLACLPVKLSYEPAHPVRGSGPCYLSRLCLFDEGDPIQEGLTRVPPGCKALSLDPVN